MYKVRVRDGEIGCEHGGCDFAAIGAVADEAIQETRARGWLHIISTRILSWEIKERRGLQHTNANCTAPQKHVAVASSSPEYPSLARPARGI